MDLCSLANVSYFDEKWGDWYFDSTDEIEWPPGTYSFRITGTVADQSDFYDLDLTLVSSCRVALFTVTSTFQDAIYQLGDPSISQTWIDADLFTVETNDASICGPVQVDFYNADTGWYFDPQFFTQDNNEFVVTQTNDVSLIGTIYNVGVWVYWVDYPDDTFGESVEPFSIKFTDVNCDIAQISAPIT